MEDGGHLRGILHLGGRGCPAQSRKGQRWRRALRARSTVGQARGPLGPPGKPRSLASRRKARRSPASSFGHLRPWRASQRMNRPTASGTARSGFLRCRTR